MKDRKPPHLPRASRRRVLQQAASMGVLAAAMPRLLYAQADDLAPYRAARVNWKQVEGESISVAVIPASYFDNLATLLPQFETLTGMQLGYHRKPIVLLNVDDYFAPLLAMIEHGIEQRFIKGQARDLYFVAATVDEAIEHIRAYEPRIAAEGLQDRATVAFPRL